MNRRWVASTIRKSRRCHLMASEGGGAPDEAHAGACEEEAGSALLERIAAHTRERIVGKTERIGLAPVRDCAGAAWGGETREDARVAS